MKNLLIYKLSSGKNEKGSVLLTTVVIMLLLTIIGIASISTSSIDLQITRNYKVYKENLILADAAINEGQTLFIDFISTQPMFLEISNEKSEAWLNIDKVDGKYLSNTKSAFNTIEVDNILKDWGSLIKPDKLSIDPTASYVLFYKKISSDPSKDYEFVVLARSQKHGGNVVVEAGFSY
ncbi:MAG: pilus assembly PilX N-terminal domain-containing protein [Desulforegulaceae bacterium]|nr:pilus assembly PilX N-terminal domain-containing protein [Desulforegulaceae bacterium]